jgi:uncharacterized membrane protein YesL
MKERFRQLRASFTNTLSFLGDIILLNLLFLVCSVPIFTIGAAATACYAGVSRTLQRKETGLVYRAFFADFKAAFRQATAGWLLQLLAFLIFAGDIWFATVYSEPDNKFFLIFAIVVGAGILMGSLWFYPLVARFQNKLGIQIKNAFLLAFAQFPRTLLTLVIWIVTLGLPFVIYEVYVYLGWLWLLAGVSLPMYWTVKLFRKTLQLDKAKEEVTVED